VQDHAVAGDLEQAPARQHVEADRRNALRREPLGDDAQKSLAQGLGNPTQHAMTDDEVERAVAWPDFIEAQRAERNVGEPETRNARLARFDLCGRQVDADKLRLRPSGGERNDMPARGAADLQDARRRCRRGGQPEPQRRRRHARRLLPHEPLGRVGSRVVARSRSGDRFLNGRWHMKRRRKALLDPKCRTRQNHRTRPMGTCHGLGEGYRVE